MSQAAIKMGGTLAGLGIIRVVNAPTAAGIAYELDKDPGYDYEEKYVIMFDLGSRVTGKTGWSAREGGVGADPNRCYGYDN
jgi:hypothetical protein